MYTVRRIDPSEWQAYRSIRLRALAEAPDAFGSTLAAEAVCTDAHWQERLSLAAAGDDLPLFAVAGAEPVGLAWAKADAVDPARVDLFQMWVDPECRRQGVGSLLLNHAVQWARAKNADWLCLGVTCGDTPAYRLYTRTGFVAVGDPEPLRDGSPIRLQPMRLALRAGVA
jgi:GNAT superfamily N-acetyltransferase